MYKALCLSGGGVAGFVHLGVLEYLDEINVLKEIDTIVCTSIGSVVGALFAVGISVKNIYSRLADVDHRILQYDKLDDFLGAYGMDSGEYFMAQMVDIFID